MIRTTLTVNVLVRGDYTVDLATEKHVTGFYAMNTMQVQLWCKTWLHDKATHLVDSARYVYQNQQWGPQPSILVVLSIIRNNDKHGYRVHQCIEYDVLNDVWVRRACYFDCGNGQQKEIGRRL